MFCRFKLRKLSITKYVILLKTKLIKIIFLVIIVKLPLIFLIASANYLKSIK